MGPHGYLVRERANGKWVVQPHYGLEPLNWPDIDDERLQEFATAAQAEAFYAELAKETEDGYQVVPLAPEPVDVPEPRFIDELTSLLNSYSKENGSSTPDFILAEYLQGCLALWDTTTRARALWFGREFNQFGIVEPGTFLS